MLPAAGDGSSAREVAHRCAAAAQRIVQAAAIQPRDIVVKGASTSGGRQDIVTATDPAVERAVVAILAEAYPEHAVLGEETGAHAGDAAWQWVIDPIDGTRNFSHGIPWIGFNLALCHEGDPRLALTLDPLRDEIFYAETGGGTTLNGRTVRVTPTERLADALLAVDLSFNDARASAVLAALHALFPNVQALRLTGSAALGLAYVAAGRFDAYLHPAAYAWDFAPGVLLVQEAGGVVTDLAGDALNFGGAGARSGDYAVVAGAAGVQAEALAHFRSAGTV